MIVNPSYLTPDWSLVRLMVQMFLKLGWTTAAVVSIPCAVIAERFFAARRFPAIHLSPRVVRAEKAKARKAIA